MQNSPLMYMCIEWEVKSVMFFAGWAQNRLNTSFHRVKSCHATGSCDAAHPTVSCHWVTYWRDLPLNGVRSRVGAVFCQISITQRNAWIQKPTKIHFSNRSLHITSCYIAESHYVIMLHHQVTWHHNVISCHHHGNCYIIMLVMVTV